MSSLVKHELSLTFMDTGTNSTRLLGFGSRIYTHYGNEQRNTQFDIYPAALVALGRHPGHGDGRDGGGLQAACDTTAIGNAEAYQSRP